MEMAESAENQRLLTFVTGGELYAADISAVTDIIEIPPITYVPMLPDYIRGIINLRGKVVPVIDLAKRLRLCDEIYDRQSCIIVFSIKSSSVGFIVSRVRDVIDVIPQQISPTPDPKSMVGAVVATEDGYYKLLRHTELVDD